LPDFSLADLVDRRHLSNLDLQPLFAFPASRYCQVRVLGSGRIFRRLTSFAKDAAAAIPYTAPGTVAHVAASLE